MHENDWVIKLTSNDPCMNHPAIVSILHLNQAAQRQGCQSNQYISLCPYVQGPRIRYCFPIYNPFRGSNIKRPEHAYQQKRVMMVGYYRRHYFDSDLVNFIRLNPDFEFVFVMRRSFHIPQLNTLHNVKWMSSASTVDLVQLLQNACTFVLSKRIIQNDRLSGQFALAVSFEIPLIVDTATRRAYQFPHSIEFTSSYSEIGSLTSTVSSKTAYLELVQAMRTFKRNCLQHNLNTFNQLYAELGLL